MSARPSTPSDDPSARALQMLGGHVVDRPAQGGRGGGGAVLEHRLARQVEVQQHGHAVGGHQHVGRLDVAVEHAAVVGVVEGLGQPGAPPGDRPGVGPARQAPPGRPSGPPAGSLGRLEPIERLDQRGAGSGGLNLGVGQDAASVIRPK